MKGHCCLFTVSLTPLPALKDGWMEVIIIILPWQGALIGAAVCPSICLSHALGQQWCILGLWLTYYSTLIGNTILKVEHTLVSVAEMSLEVTRMAVKPSMVPLQKQSPGSCTTDMPPSNCHYRRGILYCCAVLLSCNTLFLLQHSRSASPSAIHC